MILLQRARLLAAKGSKAGSVQGASQQSIQGLNASTSRSVLHGQNVAPSLGRTSNRTCTPQEAAVLAAVSEDMEMKTFFENLQNHRDDSRTESTSGPTVPTVLSRRILQRQGVGYLDSTVGAVASAMADRFLATILQQSKACRDQRLKGAELSREASRHRWRHRNLYENDVRDRHRRRHEKEIRREKVNLSRIQAAESIRTTGLSKEIAKDVDTKSKKKSKILIHEDVAKSSNGSKSKNKDSKVDYYSDDDKSFDSIDEEAAYYQQFFEQYGRDRESEADDEDDNEMIILHDLERPLESWDLTIRGKDLFIPGVEAISKDHQDYFFDEINIEDTESCQENDVGGHSDPVDVNSQPNHVGANAMQSTNDAKSPSDDSTKILKRKKTSPVPIPFHA